MPTLKPTRIVLLIALLGPVGGLLLLSFAYLYLAIATLSLIALCFLIVLWRNSEGVAEIPVQWADQQAAIERYVKEVKKREKN